MECSFLRNNVTSRTGLENKSKSFEESVKNLINQGRPLPKELILHIFSFFNKLEVHRFKRACKLWHLLCEKNSPIENVYEANMKKNIYHRSITPFFIPHKDKKPSTQINELKFSMDPKRKKLSISNIKNHLLSIEHEDYYLVKISLYSKKLFVSFRGTNTKICIWKIKKDKSGLVNLEFLKEIITAGNYSYYYDDGNLFLQRKEKSNEPKYLTYSFKPYKITKQDIEQTSFRLDFEMISNQKEIAFAKDDEQVFIAYKNLEGSGFFIRSFFPFNTKKSSCVSTHSQTYSIAIEKDLLYLGREGSIQIYNKDLTHKNGFPTKDLQLAYAKENTSRFPIMNLYAQIYQFKVYNIICWENFLLFRECSKLSHFNSAEIKIYKYNLIEWSYFSKIEINFENIYTGYFDGITDLAMRLDKKHKKLFATFIQNRKKNSPEKKYQLHIWNIDLNSNSDQISFKHCYHLKDLPKILDFELQNSRLKLYFKKGIEFFNLNSIA